MRQQVLQGQTGDGELSPASTLPQEPIRASANLAAATYFGVVSVEPRPQTRVSKTCASILQDTAKHNRQELVPFCQGCWHFTDFRHNRGTIAALELMTKLKIDACRTASSTQGRLRGALASQEIAKYIEYCLKPGKAPGPYKCSNELLKTMSDEEFLIV